MNIKLFVMTAFLLVFSVLVSGMAQATHLASIDTVIVNSRVLAESKTNLVEESNQFLVSVTLTGIINTRAKVDAVLTNLNTGNTISDSSTNFPVLQGQSVGTTLTLNLLEPIATQRDYRLLIKVVDVNGKLEQKSYNIRLFGPNGIISDKFDVSIDRVRVNADLVVPLSTNFIDETNQFNVLVDFTTIEDLNDAHVEVVLKDLRTGFSIADATANFDLQSGSSSSVLLTLNLIDPLDDSSSFELIVRIIDIEGRSVKNVYRIEMEDGVISGRGFDVSIDRVRVNGALVVPSTTNFIDENDQLNVVVDFTALENLEDARVEVVLKDLITGFAVSEASANFDLQEGFSSSNTLILNLIEPLDDSDRFELIVRIADAEGDSLQQVYGVRMKDDIVGDGTGRTLDVSINSVEVESNIVAENENNFVVIGESKNDLDVRVKLTALENIEDGRIEAILTFENGDVVADATTTFDLNDGDSEVEKLELPLIGKFEQASFKLRIRVVDAEGNVEEKVYGLKISQKDFPFVVSSLSVEPENGEAGKNVVVKLRFKNSGVMPLEGLLARVSVPELGVSSTKFIDTIKNIGSDMEQEFILKILDSAATGTYTLRGEIVSQFGGESEVKSIPFFVLGLNEQVQQIVNDKLVINAQLLKQDIKADGNEVIYPLVFTNEGKDANAYTILLNGLSWANLRLDESNVFVLKPKETKQINVFASTNTKARGEQAFLVTIKTDDKVLKQIPLKGNVTGTAKISDLKSILKTALISIVVVLAAIGLFFGVKDYFQSKEIKETEYEQIEPYY